MIDKLKSLGLTANQLHVIVVVVVCGVIYLKTGGLPPWAQAALAGSFGVQAITGSVIPKKDDEVKE
jgi:hypothetical protein